MLRKRRSLSLTIELLQEQHQWTTLFTRCGGIQGSPSSPLPPSMAYSRVGRQTHAGGSQLELPSVEEDPPSAGLHTPWHVVGLGEA